MSERPDTMSVPIQPEAETGEPPDTMSIQTDEVGQTPDTMSVPTHELATTTPPRTMSVPVDAPDDIGDDR